MFYRVRCFDPRNSAVEEYVQDVPSVDDIASGAAAKGWVLLGFQETKQADAAHRMAARWWQRTSSFSVSWWCHELRTLLLAGMTVVEALETLQAQTPADRRGEVQSTLIAALRRGKSLSRAMLEVPEFPAVLVASVTASERTSTLPTALDDYLKHDEMMVSLRRQVVSAALYPALVVSLGVIISLFLLLYVIPRFAGMYVDFQGNLSVATRLLLWISRTVASHSLLIVGTFAALGVAVGWAARNGRAVRGLQALGLSFKPLQRQWDHFRLAKLYQSLALMFKGGYTLDEAFKVCESLGLGTRITSGLRQAARELLCGRGVATALTSAHLTDAVSERLLAVGERTGSFDVVLQAIADRHAAAFATFVHRTTKLVEPILLMLVATVVGGIVVLMYMPIFDIASGIR